MSSEEPSIAEQLAGLPDEQAESLIASLTPDECKALIHHWPFWARPGQLPPVGDWFCWLVLAGRGFGKTRMGAEWVRTQVEGPTPCISGSEIGRIALLSQTFADARDVMIEGDSGLLAISSPGARPAFEISRRRLIWPNGAVAHIYSADEPDQLRGPQHHMAWADEIAKWRNIEACWANLVLGLRLGDRPRVVVTTTPRPLRFLRKLVADPRTRVTRGRTLDNAANLSPAFLGEVERLYRGTSLGRQELNGVLLTQREGALWTAGMIEEARIARAPDMERVVVAIDPPVSSSPTASECGIIIAGRGVDGLAYVLEDRSCRGRSPLGWIREALAAFAAHEADRLIAEVNQGGDLVEALLRQEAPRAPYAGVRATRSKLTRAEPVAALYERGLVRHAGVFAELEEQMLDYSGATNQPSPDRLDALVWAISGLMLGNNQEPRIRTI